MHVHVVLVCAQDFCCNYAKEILKSKNAIMFTLLRGLWNYFFQKDEFFVVILGLDNAGKTVWSGEVRAGGKGLACEVIRVALCV